jgi:Fungal specific transcription factor domain/Fungal Zn(2)-Cys(6) binuclear cluster domain
MAQLSHAKLEIPRLDPPREPALAAQSRAAAGKNRTSRACDHCRNARAKCSGGEPCKRCGDMLTKCAYSEGKRELHKKCVQPYVNRRKKADDDCRLVGRLRDENGELSRKTQLYATMLNSLSQHPMMPQSDRDAILDLLTISTVESQSVSRSHEFDSETDTELSRSRGTSDRIDEHGGSGGIPGLERTFASYSPFVPSSEAHTDTASKHDRNHLAPAESWTNVTNNGGLVEHLLALYFCWEYPTFASLSRKHFLADFHTGKRRYCSSLLVNALLALGSRFSDMPEARKRQDDPDSAGEHFFEECKRLLGQEEFPSLPTIQALGLMSLRQASHGNDGSSWSYARQSMRMALDLDLHLGQQIRGLPETPLSQEEIEVCTATFWGCYNLEQ